MELPEILRSLVQLCISEGAAARAKSGSMRGDNQLDRLERLACLLSTHNNQSDCSRVPGLINALLWLFSRVRQR
jgi:hypothetical protein